MNNENVGRPVVFKKWIPAEYIPNTNPMKKVEGTGCFTEMIHQGKFLGWGVEFHEFENGIGNQTVALIEVTGKAGVKDRGTVLTVLPCNMKFGWKKAETKTPVEMQGDNLDQKKRNTAFYEGMENLVIVVEEHEYSRFLNLLTRHDEVIAETVPNVSPTGGCYFRFSTVLCDWVITTKNAYDTVRTVGELEDLFFIRNGGKPN